MRSAIFTIVLAACGNNGNNGNNHTQSDAHPTPDAAVDAPNDTPFSCADFAYCTTDTVGSYVGTVDAPAGGTIRDGMYRRAWEIAATASDPDSADALEIRGNQYVSGTTMGRGTIETSGTHLTLALAEECNTGVDVGPATDETDSFDYTAEPDRLILFIAEEQFVTEQVWLAVTDACATVATPPAGPGDSFSCRDAPCQCAAVTDGDIDQCPH